MEPVREQCGTEINPQSADSTVRATDVAEYYAIHRDFPRKYPNSAGKRWTEITKAQRNLIYIVTEGFKVLVEFQNTSKNESAMLMKYKMIQVMILHSGFFNLYRDSYLPDGYAA